MLDSSLTATNGVVVGTETIEIGAVTIITIVGGVLGEEVIILTGGVTTVMITIHARREVMATDTTIGRAMIVIVMSHIKMYSLFVNKNLM